MMEWRVPTIQLLTQILINCREFNLIYLFELLNTITGSMILKKKSTSSLWNIVGITLTLSNSEYEWFYVVWTMQALEEHVGMYCCKLQNEWNRCWYCNKYWKENQTGELDLGNWINTCVTNKKTNKSNAWNDDSCLLLSYPSPPPSLSRKGMPTDSNNGDQIIAHWFTKYWKVTQVFTKTV